MVKRRVFDNEKHIHFVTFSCYKRRTLLQQDHAKRIVSGQLGSRAGETSRNRHRHRDYAPGDERNGSWFKGKTGKVRYHNKGTTVVINPDGKGSAFADPNKATFKNEAMMDPPDF